MTYRRHFSTSGSVGTGGFISLDIILALVVCTVFLGIITGSSIESRNIFERAKVRSILIEGFEAHSGDFMDLMPHESRSRSYSIGTTSTDLLWIVAQGKWYGNDRIETVLKVSVGSMNGSTTMGFDLIRAYPYADSNLFAGTPLCSVEPSKEPISVIAIALPINPSLPLTDLIVRNDTAYLSTDSSTASDPDIMVVDMNNRSAPVVLSSLNTGPGISAISLANKYLYAAAASTAAELHVIRLDSLNTPILVKKYQLPLPSASTSPPMGTSIFYDKGKVYLGTDKWDGREFSIVDVSLPESPGLLGGIETDSKVNAIYVRNDTAYVGASDMNQLRTVNVSNSTNPFVTQTISPSGWQRQEGKALNMFEDDLSFGRTSGGFNIIADHELFYWNASSTLKSIDVPGGIYGIQANRNNLYTISRTTNREVAIYDRTLSTSTAEYLSLPVLPQSMTCDGDSIYVLAKTAPVIYEIKR